MPLANPKNFPLGAAATDLGFGLRIGEDDLLDEEKRKKLLKEKQQSMPGNFGDLVMGNAAMELFSGFASRKVT